MTSEKWPLHCGKADKGIWNLQEKVASSSASYCLILAMKECSANLPMSDSWHLNLKALSATTYMGTGSLKSTLYLFLYYTCKQTAIINVISLQARVAWWLQATAYFF